MARDQPVYNSGTASRCVPSEWLEIESQCKLHRSRLVTLRVDSPEARCAPVRVRIAKQRAVEEIADLGFEPQFERILQRHDLEQAQVLTVCRKSADGSVAGRRVAKLER